MEKVNGIGGVFFLAKNPDGLSRWYREYLGVESAPPTYDAAPWRQDAGPTVFAPFPESTTYFGEARRTWMVNFRVRDLDAMTAQLREAGITVDVDPLSNASSAASRPPSHGWGPGWLATPSLYDSCIRDSLPVYPGAIRSVRPDLLPLTDSRSSSAPPGSALPSSLNRWRTPAWGNNRRWY